MAQEDVAAAAINQPGHGGESVQRPLKRWRLFVAGKGRTSLLMQSARSEPGRSARGESASARPPRRSGRPAPGGPDTVT